MKRALALHGLSREHREALVLARHACATAVNPLGPVAQAQRTHLLERWALQFAPHFSLEERTLFPLAQSLFEPIELTDVMNQSASRPSAST